jgi:hypothetical protein
MTRWQIEVKLIMNSIAVTSFLLQAPCTLRFFFLRWFFHLNFQNYLSKLNFCSLLISISLTHFLYYFFYTLLYFDFF